MAVREMMTITATTKDHEALALVLEMGTETVALTVALTVTVIAITTEDLGTLALVPLAEGGGNESGAENLPAKPGIATHARRLLPRGWRSDIFLGVHFLFLSVTIKSPQVCLFKFLRPAIHLNRSPRCTRQGLWTLGRSFRYKAP